MIIDFSLGSNHTLPSSQKQTDTAEHVMLVLRHGFLEVFSWQVSHLDGLSCATFVSANNVVQALQGNLVTGEWKGQDMTHGALTFNSEITIVET